MDQGRYANRLKLCIPVLGVGAVLGIGNAVGAIDYTVIWRYFSWTNQTLAMIVLWTASMYLFREKKNYWIRESSLIQSVCQSEQSILMTLSRIWMRHSKP